jgi:hypothetical protein
MTVKLLLLNPGLDSSAPGENRLFDDHCEGVSGILNFGETGV